MRFCCTFGIMNSKHYILFPILSLLSAILLSAGFLFPHCGGFTLIAFVPLLWMDRIARNDGCRHFWWWHYLTFVLWNAFTTFWVCNATVGGGIAAILINALQMSVIWALFRLFAKRLDGHLPYIFLMTAWISWEKLYFNAEISWPWLTLGNAFAYSTTCVQWYEITGTLGGSLWIWLSNLTIFRVMVLLQEQKWTILNAKARAAIAIWTFLLLVVPPVASWIRYATYTSEGSEGLEVSLIQPNIDPYHKFQALSQAQQNEIITGLIDSAYASHPDSTRLLVIAPETVTGDIVLNNLNGSPTMLTFNRKTNERKHTDLIFGASTYGFIDSETAPSHTARKASEGMWYENYNSAFLVNGTNHIEYCHKSKLVVGVEKMPYPALMSKLDRALGGVMGHCIGQDEVSLLYAGRKEPVGCAICYESVYPEHFASYVGKGARAMTVITNDAWWGDTPGYRQHLHYSCLRAIETRRDIARCANTGISAFINSRGDIVSETQWWTREVLDGRIQLNDNKTVFVRTGDVTGRLCILVAVLMTLNFLLTILLRRNEPKKPAAKKGRKAPNRCGR